jgi:hypothetical protein
MSIALQHSVTRRPDLAPQTKLRNRKRCARLGEVFACSGAGRGLRFGTELRVDGGGRSVD